MNLKGIICQEIVSIVDAHRSGECSTPGGLEHMGDVWKLFYKWETLLKNNRGLEAGCQRSHPHEEMDGECILKTEIAVLRNNLAHMTASRDTWMRRKQRLEFELRGWTPEQIDAHMKEPS